MPKATVYPENIISATQENSCKKHITQEANNAEEVTLHKKGEKHNKQMHQANTDVSERAHVPSHSCLKFTTYLLKLVTVERGKDIIGRKKVKVVN